MTGTWIDDVVSPARGMTARRALICLAAAIIGAVLIAVLRGYAQADNSKVKVVTEGPVTTLNGSDAIHPKNGSLPFSSGPGAEGFNNDQFKNTETPYVVPGEGEAPEDSAPKNAHALPNAPFSIAYDNPAAFPVQSNDWWPGVGLQWFVPSTGAGWASVYPNFTRATPFTSEPLRFDFVDYNNNGTPAITQTMHGLRLWNQNQFYINTTGTFTLNQTGKQAPFDIANNTIGYAAVAPETQASVTVGLEGVHPICMSTACTAPTTAPWTNIRVNSYSDWGVVLRYATKPDTDKTGGLKITMAVGSPFVWFEKPSTNTTNNFIIWAGGNGPVAGVPQGSIDGTFYNKNGILGLIVTTVFNPVNPMKFGQTVAAQAAYVIYSDQGDWVRQNDPNSAPAAAFRNKTATRVAVLAVPSSILAKGAAELRKAADSLAIYSCRKITDTRIDYPPIGGSQTTATVGTKTVPLGYLPQSSLLRLQLRTVMGDPTYALPQAGCDPTDGTPPLLLLFPHQVKALPVAQQAQLDTTRTWDYIIGPLTAYKGLVAAKGVTPTTTFVQELPARGVLPFFPDIVARFNLANPIAGGPATAVDDVYKELKTWFFLVADNPKTDPFAFNEDFYLGGSQQNLYNAGFASAYESLVIADQLAKSPNLKGNDTDTSPFNACLCRPKTQVAAEMRDFILQRLKEHVGEWADAYQTKVFQYNPTFKDFYGFPTGFFAVQNVGGDHHFLWGYFLRAMAAIGFYDPVWLTNYKPLIAKMQMDVANFDRTNTNFPFLRNFNPYHGHNWADGAGGPDGNNQESTSEAINYSVGLIELGQLLNDTKLRDVGMYLFEQEVAAVQQYWQNVDALSDPGKCFNNPPQTGPGGVVYCGSWPDNWVNYPAPAGHNPPKGPAMWHTTLSARVFQRHLARDTFFNATPGFSNTEPGYFIQQIPMSAATLYIARSPAWVSATWNQLLLDIAWFGNSNPAASNFNDFFGAMQSLMPDKDVDGTTINRQGLLGALTRINQPHPRHGGATLAMAKYWAYTNNLLGQLDVSFTANVPNYGAFSNQAKGECTFVAYNPGASAISVTFSKNGNGVATFNVPPLSMVAQVNGGTGCTTMKKSTTFSPDRNRNDVSNPAETPRMFLRTATGPDSGPLKGVLSATAGTGLPIGTSTLTFADIDSSTGAGGTTLLSNLSKTMAIIPEGTQNCSALCLPGDLTCCPGSTPTFIRWDGKLDGNLVGGVLNGTSLAITRFAIYFNPSLRPGWQRNPFIGSNANVRVSYFFSGDTTKPADRVEFVDIGMDPSNSFINFLNRVTNYDPQCIANTTVNPGFCTTSSGQIIPSGYFIGGTPSGTPNQPTGRFLQLGDYPRSTGTARFPACVKNGVIRVEVWGGAGPKMTGDGRVIRYPMPVSVDASPLTNRASYVQPPYDGNTCTPSTAASVGNAVKTSASAMPLEQ